MNARNGRNTGLDDILHRRLLSLIVLSYALAAIAPGAGLLIRDAHVNLRIARAGIVTLPQLLLSFLLFCAGLRVRGERVRHIFHRPSPILIGLLANLAIPLVYLLLVTPFLRGWHNASEAGTILIGLALVAAMPVAGSSTGWAQNSGGDMTLSLGLVIASTMLSPLTTPAALRIVGWMSPTGYGDELHVLAGAEDRNFCDPVGAISIVAWHRRSLATGRGPRDSDGTSDKGSELDHAVGPLLRQRLGLPAAGPWHTGLGFPCSNLSFRDGTLWRDIRIGTRPWPSGRSRPRATGGADVRPRNE